jgi:hypothetical protein
MAGSDRDLFWRQLIRVPIWRRWTGEINHPALEQTLAILLSSALACCRWELERRHMTPPSSFVLRIIIEEDRKLVRTLNANYAGAAPDGGLDASECDALFDVLGLHFTGRLWPRSGGMGTTRRFMTDLQHAMSAAGWKVDVFAVTA